MKWTLRILAGAAVPALVLICAAMLQAAEEGNAGEQSTGTAFRWIHFVILAGALVYIIRRFGRPYFRSNADAITDAIAKATAAKKTFHPGSGNKIRPVMARTCTAQR